MARKSNAGIRLSVAPLLGMLAAKNIDVEFIEGNLNQQIRNAKFRGYFTLGSADEIACKILKMHPAEVWGAEYAEKCWHDGEDLQGKDLEKGMADVQVRRLRVAA